jgi:hypothetical protein
MFGLVAVSWLTSVDAHATLIQVNAQTTYTGSAPEIIALIPTGTVVTTDIMLEIGSGTPLEIFPSVVASSGNLTWDNGGPQNFSVSHGFFAGLGSDGRVWIALGWHGQPIDSYPTIDGYALGSFTIQFDIGVDLNTTTDELSDLLLAGSVDSLRVRVFEEGFLEDGIFEAGVSGPFFGDIYAQMADTITEGHAPIPEPGSAALFGVGSLLVATRVRRWRRNQK